MFRESNMRESIKSAIRETLSFLKYLIIQIIPMIACISFCYFLNEMWIEEDNTFQIVFAGVSLYFALWFHAFIR
jgi:hypothetical protein